MSFGRRRVERFRTRPCPLPFGRYSIRTCPLDPLHQALRARLSPATTAAEEAKRLPSSWPRRPRARALRLAYRHVGRFDRAPRAGRDLPARASEAHMACGRGRRRGGPVGVRSLHTFVSSWPGAGLPSGVASSGAHVWSGK